MALYSCYAPAHPFPAEMIEADTGLFARKAYGRKHGFNDTSCIISRREDLIDDKWRKFTGMAPAGWSVVEA
ncbi:hypothetical protein [Bradyrhizobium elkanii]|uniref:hypothetical protein n=1 Tax=Bradyrhizobium elkanii TaxID=29448 RepID=UPI0035156B02